MSPVDGVFEADELIPSEVRKALLDGVARLGGHGTRGYDMPAEDWHPGSNRQVLDLVHPSMFCYVEGQTRVLPKEGLAWDAWIGAGEPALVMGGEKHDPFASGKYAWLPSDVSVSHDHQSASFDSYINNLHPKQHADLYRAIGGIFARMLPLFNQVLSQLADPAPNRISAEYEWREERGDLFEDEGELEDESEDEFQGPVRQPAVPAFVPRGPKVKVELAGRRLQVIVKLANIELGPTSPRFPGGAWHVEGMKNERIVASGIYYYHCENVTPSKLSFRTAVCEPDYEQGDDRGVQEVYGLSDGGPLNLSLIHISEPTRLLSISYAVFCLKKKKNTDSKLNT
eukprot:TRINITY_DN12905_c0_g1_i1.p1 TRINITY_DN12905_c0_g1~~TRINITY_DN12905_c0_g1_i1.p1  ORF type:complete len:341 (+),score=83.66 TRINITY_DN12905_c0_g1_i1:356-1378(+)